MNCPRCGSQNSDSARFCKDCGETFVWGQGTRPTDQQQWQTPDTDPAANGNQAPQGAYYQPPVYQPPMQNPYTPYQGYSPYNNGYMPPAQRPVFNSAAAIIAIIFGLLCSWWFGSIFAIVGLVKGNKVDTLWLMGDYQGAYNAAAEGNKYVKISWIVSGIGCALVVLYFFVIFFAAMASSI